MITENVNGVLHTHSAEPENVGGVIREKSLVSVKDGGVIKTVFSSAQVRVSGITPTVVGENYLVIRSSGTLTLSAPVGTRITIGDGGNCGCAAGSTTQKQGGVTTLKIGTKTYTGGDSRAMITTRAGSVGGGGKGGNGGSGGQGGKAYDDEEATGYDIDSWGGNGGNGGNGGKGGLPNGSGGNGGRGANSGQNHSSYSPSRRKGFGGNGGKGGANGSGTDNGSNGGYGTAPYGQAYGYGGSGGSGGVGDDKGIYSYGGNGAAGAFGSTGSDGTRNSFDGEDGTNGTNGGDGGNGGFVAQYTLTEELKNASCTLTIGKGSTGGGSNGSDGVMIVEWD